VHPNPLYRQPTPDENLAFARMRGFGVLTINGRSGPVAAHVPFVLDEAGATLELHLSQKNGLLKHLDGPTDALVVVSGPDAYVSPDWYEGLEAPVPTWNYVAVHLRGMLWRCDPDEMPRHLERLAEVHEAVLAPKVPWTPAAVPEAQLAAMRAAIVALRLSIASVEGTWKLGQNKPVTARRSAADAIAEAAYGQEAAALADTMRRSTD